MNNEIEFVRLDSVGGPYQFWKSVKMSAPPEQKLALTSKPIWIFFVFVSSHKKKNLDQQKRESGFFLAGFSGSLSPLS